MNSSPQLLFVAFIFFAALQLSKANNFVRRAQGPSFAKTTLNTAPSSRQQITCRITASEDVEAQQGHKVNCNPILQMKDGQHAQESSFSYRVSLPKYIAEPNEQAIANGNLLVLIDGASLNEETGEIELLPDAMWVAPLGMATHSH